MEDGKGQGQNVLSSEDFTEADAKLCKVSCTLEREGQACCTHVSVFHKGAEMFTTVQRCSQEQRGTLRKYNRLHTELSMQ